MPKIGAAFEEKRLKKEDETRGVGSAYRTFPQRCFPTCKGSFFQRRRCWFECFTLRHTLRPRTSSQQSNQSRDKISTRWREISAAHLITTAVGRSQRGRKGHAPIFPRKTTKVSLEICPSLASNAFKRTLRPKSTTDAYGGRNKATSS